MDISALSMSISQSSLQTSASIAVMKMAMCTGEQNTAKMIDMVGDSGIDTNLGNNIDVSA